MLIDISNKIEIGTWIKVLVSHYLESKKMKRQKVQCSHTSKTKNAPKLEDFSEPPNTTEKRGYF